MAQALLKNIRFTPKIYLPAMGVIAVIGAALLIRSFAGTGKTISFEAENAVASGNVTKVTGGGASGDSFLLFRPTGSSTPAPAPAPAPAGNAVTPESFGAAGNGSTDDTAALQRAFDSLGPNKILQLSAGKTYRHTGVLKITKAGAHITGGGTLLATNQTASSVWVDADNVTIDGGVTFKMNNATSRGDAWEHHKLVIFDVKGASLKNITIDGSHAAGVFIDGAREYLLEDVTVKNTRADGIHNTGGANNGTIRRAVVDNVGDDGIAVVSYGNNASACNNITIESPRMLGQTWGRGLTVIGGHDITLSNVYVEKSAGAGILIGTEGHPWNTYAASRIKVLGGEIKNANHKSELDHGAILIMNGRSGITDSDIYLENLKISNTRSSASDQVRVLVYDGNVSRIEMKNFTITGGSNIFGSLNLPNSAYRRTGWTWNGTAQADHRGY